MRIAFLLVLGVLAITVSPALAQQTGVEMADSLVIRKIADDDMLPDCTTITVDVSGRPVASGPGYIRLLVDSDSDGVFDKYTTLVDKPSHGAHGLCFDGGALYYVGDNGVWKVTDTDEDGVVDSQPTRMLEIKTGGEHDAHALRRGPDGSWYLICGNGTKGMFDLQNVETPVIPNPRAGAIWRISPDWSEREVWAHGFRNAYDFDFAPDHAIDTFDSDGERDVSLPWYRPTRVYRVRQGDDAGWMTRSWKRPNVDPMMPKVLAELGRGSPTGVLRYRHRRLPERFHDGVFVLDWTFGRIFFIGDDANSELIAQPSGTTGFAVTDIESFPDGRLLVSVGGRGSRGGLYEIDAIEPTKDRSPATSIWGNERTNPSVAATTDWIRRLRNQRERSVDQRAAVHAARALGDVTSNRSKRIAAITLLIESVGGLGVGDSKDARGKEQVAAVFDSCRSRLRPKLDSSITGSATRSLIRIVQDETADEVLVTEAIRGLAVIEGESKEVFATIVSDMNRVESPIEKLHRLVALARLPVSRSDEMTEQIVEAMLEIPVLVEDRGLNIDRNWTARLGELFVAFERRDSLLPSRLVAHPSFGHPTHLVWTERMDPENLERARRVFLLRRGGKMGAVVARFIALGDDAVPRGIIREWLENPATQPAAWLAIASHPNASDVDQLQQAVMSVDKNVREAAEKSLKRLGAAIPERVSDSQTIQTWLKKTETIVSLEGEATNGQKLFMSRQCGICHDGAKALGPSLAGISKRFSLSDLFRASVDPNHTIPDRYRAKQVLTSDDRVLVGMVIYESVDGLTLLTADAKTLRINIDSIAEVKSSTKSLMPEGLLEGLTDQNVADLLAYMRSL